AAAALHSTQPTVSRYISALERQIGQALFDRHSQGMTLTVAGDALLPRARLILHEMELAQDSMDAIRGLRRGTLRVGGGTAVTRGVLPEILAGIAQSAPQLRIEVLEASEDRLESALSLREVDVIFATEAPQGVETSRVGPYRFEDRVLPFCSAQNPLGTNAHVELRQLVGLMWALPRPGATPRLHFERLVSGLGLQMPEVMLQTDSVDLIIQTVARSALLGWLPVQLLSGALNSGAVKVLEVPQLEWLRTFRPYRRATGSFPATAQFLIDAMAKHSVRPDSASPRSNSPRQPPAWGGR
ncbi:MAG TPA: LysR family transcriptional regulator, partial [Steroidobacteraceae bacterium]